jgi:hypothetical protein
MRHSALTTWEAIAGLTSLLGPGDRFRWAAGHDR